MDLQFYITTQAGYCGNCTDSSLFFGNIKDHVIGSLKHYKTLPETPKWLPIHKLHRLASKAIKLSNSNQGD